MSKIRSLLLALLLAAALAACGGGGTGTGTDTGTAGDNPNVDSPMAGDETPGTGDALGDSENDGLDAPTTSP